MRKLMSATAFVSLMCACSLNKEKGVGANSEIFGSKDYAESIVSKVPSKWFGGPQRFSLQDRAGDPVPHLFFDVDPSVDPKRKVLNFVVTTPQNYSTEQSLDISSGQLYMSRQYCAQTDAWKKYSGKVDRPPFTIGFVPRVLDQLNLPQKIIVFGQKDYYQKHFNTNYFDARVVGGYVEQVCPKGGCVEKNSWYSRLVLIGVQRNNKKYEKVKGIEDLKKMVDWPLVKAFVGNGGGQNSISGALYPAYRMGAEVDGVQAMAFLERNSHFFGMRELTKMRSGCHKLYDHMWTEFSKPGEKSFLKTFKTNFVKYKDRYNTCVKYVYPTSVNENPQRHWFFAYLTGYYKLADMGYYYSCERKTWLSNPMMGNGKRLVSDNAIFRFCPESGIDDGMKQMVRFMEVLRGGFRPSLRYIDYDKSALGTHMKMYSWVDQDNKVLECSKGADGVYLKNKMSVFPRDIRWEDRAQTKKESEYVR